MDLVGQAGWDLFRQVIRNAHDTFNQQDITWMRAEPSLDYHGEDNIPPFTPITLKVLAFYNSFRTWPTNQPTTTGELDRQTVVIYLNKDYLRENDWLNNNDNFNFQPDKDYFILDGIIYKATGETDISQAHGDPLLTQVILSRQEGTTGLPTR
jgi:hypothetical protein